MTARNNIYEYERRTEPLPGKPPADAIRSAGDIERRLYSGKDAMSDWRK